MRRGIVRLKSKSVANPLHRNLGPAGLVRDHAEEVQGVGVGGLRGEDLAVERLGLRELPGLVMLEGQGEGLLRGHGRGAEVAAHHRRHIIRKAASRWRANRGASMRGEACILDRKVARSSARRERSAARSMAMRM